MKLGVAVFLAIFAATNCMVIEPNQKEVVPTNVGTLLDCVKCNFVINEVKREVKHSHDREVVERAVHNCCGYLLGEHEKADCEIVIEKHSSDITEMIIKSVITPEICKLIDVCLVTTYNGTTYSKNLIRY